MSGYCLCELQFASSSAMPTFKLPSSSKTKFGKSYNQLSARAIDNNAFLFYSNVFGLFIGATTMPCILLGFCRSHLPNQRTKELEELLGETQDLYASAVENGILPDFETQAKQEADSLSMFDFLRVGNATDELVRVV